MRWAVQKIVEKVRGRDDMEIGEMQEATEAMWEGQEEWGYEEEWSWDDGKYNVGKSKAKRRGKPGGEATEV